MKNERMKPIIIGVNVALLLAACLADVDMPAGPVTGLLSPDYTPFKTGYIDAKVSLDYPSFVGLLTRHNDFISIFRFNPASSEKI
jgi:hypothetical protein